MNPNPTPSALAAAIDHSLLKAVATGQSVKALCAEARAHGFAMVCVNPCWVGLCVDELAGSGIGVCAVVGFPLGANRTETKAAEAALAVAGGAAGIDMVINLGCAKSGDWAAVEADIRAVVRASAPVPVKAILETCVLTDAEKIAACRAAMAAGARFAMTSTGFGTGGATVEDVRLLKKTVGDAMLVKASGGIRTRSEAVAMLLAGADRIGASSGVSIVSPDSE